MYGEVSCVGIIPPNLIISAVPMLYLTEYIDTSNSSDESSEIYLVKISNRPVCNYLRFYRAHEKV